MEEGAYAAILSFKTDGSLPASFSSTKSNFVALCSKFAVNSAGYLTRNEKIVLQKKDLERNYNRHNSI